MAKKPLITEARTSINLMSFPLSPSSGINAIRSVQYSRALFGGFAIIAPFGPVAGQVMVPPYLEKAPPLSPQ